MIVTADSSSLTVQATVTSDVYQSLEPTVPLIVFVMTGGVVSEAAVTLSVKFALLVVVPVPPDTRCEMRCAPAWLDEKLTVWRELLPQSVNVSRSMWLPALFFAETLFPDGRSIRSVTGLVVEALQLPWPFGPPSLFSAVRL